MRLEVQYGNIGIFSKYSKEKYVNLLILTFPIEWCYFQLHKLSRSRDTVTKKWSREPYTSLYIVRRVHLTTARFNVSLSFWQKIVTYRQTNIPFSCSFWCWIQWWKLEVHMFSRSWVISSLNFHPSSFLYDTSEVWVLFLPHTSLFFTF